MPFKSAGEPRQWPGFTINGQEQDTPEGPGSLPRRFRLFGECARRLAAEPLASPDAKEVPIGEGFGLNELVSIIEPVFAREPSMIRWAALRGAVALLYVDTYDPASRRVHFYPTVELYMGVGLMSHPTEPREVFGVGTAWSNRLSKAHQDSAVTTYKSVRNRLLAYEQYSKMTLEAINAHPRVRVGPAVGLEILAWTSVAFARMGRDFEELPEPDELDEPGWYTEPVFGQVERYWDGQDWTAKCRRHASDEKVEYLKLN